MAKTRKPTRPELWRIVDCNLQHLCQYRRYDGMAFDFIN